MTQLMNPGDERHVLLPGLPWRCLGGLVHQRSANTHCVCGSFIVRHIAAVSIYF